MCALPTPNHDDEPVLPSSRVMPEFISREEGERLLDEQARKYLGISGPEFRRRVREGEPGCSDDPNYMRVWFLLDLGME